MCVSTRVFSVYASKMASQKGAGSVVAVGGMGGASGPGAQNVIPMEVDQGVGSGTSLGKPGPSG